MASRISARLAPPRAKGALVGAFPAVRSCGGRTARRACWPIGFDFVGRVGGTARNPIDRYSFPPQDNETRGDEARPRSRRRRKLGSVQRDRAKVGSRSRSGRTAAKSIQKRSSRRDDHRYRSLGRIPLSGSRTMWSITAWRATDHICRPAICSCAHAPRLGGQPIEVEGETTLRPHSVSRRPALNGGVFPIQGPPGAGKTSPARG